MAWAHCRPSERSHRGRVRSPGTIELVISSAWVRYLVIPWAAKFQREKSFGALLQSAFVETFGERALRWTTQASNRQFEKPVLAAALDRAFLEALLASLSGFKLEPTLIQPDLIFAYRLHRKALIAPAFWFVLQADGQVAMLLHDDYAVQAVRVEEEGDTPLDALIERAARSLAVDSQDYPSYVVTAHPAERQRSGVQAFSMSQQGGPKPGKVVTRTMLTAADVK